MRASRYVARRFNTRYGLSDLYFAIEVWLSLEKLDMARSLVSRCLRGIEEAEYPEMSVILIHCLARYCNKIEPSDEALYVRRKLRRLVIQISLELSRT